MSYKPVDEMSLRHLFSTDYAKSQLKMAYVGPVITATGKIDTSPDALILDMRRSPYEIKRCEFKFNGKSKDDFSHNGQFDLAIIWMYEAAKSKEQLKADLLKQNGCYEIICLSEMTAFEKFIDFKYDTVYKGKMIEDIKKIVIKREEHFVVVAYILAKCAHTYVNSDNLKKYLVEKYPAVRAMQPQGRGNIITAFMQTKPQLTLHHNADNYRWNIDFDPALATIELAKILRQHYSEPPMEDDIAKILER